VEERYFIFTGVKYWPLIRTERIQTISSKLSSWAIRFWQLKAAWVDLFGVASRLLCCQSARKNHIKVWSSVRPSFWCMVWLIDEALNVLKMWPPEQLSGDKMMKKMTNIRWRVVWSIFLLSVFFFVKAALFHLNETMSFWILGF